MVSLDERYLDVLGTLSSRLADRSVTWALTGSTSFALQGVALTPDDIDLQTTAEGAYAVEELFPKQCVEPVSFAETGSIRSHFGALVLDGIRIEVMGAVQKRQADGTWEPPVDVSEHRTVVDVDGTQIPVLSLDYEAAAYERLGRSTRPLSCPNTPSETTARALCRPPLGTSRRAKSELRETLSGFTGTTGFELRETVASPRATRLFRIPVPSLLAVVRRQRARWDSNYAKRSMASPARWDSNHPRRSLRSRFSTSNPGAVAAHCRSQTTGTMGFEPTTVGLEVRRSIQTELRAPPVTLS